jgi:hypothetical protein
MSYLLRLYDFVKTDALNEIKLDQRTILTVAGSSVIGFGALFIG